MAQAGVSTVGGYGNPVINNDGSMLVDTEDGIPVVGPTLNAVTGQLSAAVINPAVPANTGVPELNAILIELRVLTALVHAQLGATNLDLEQMRADELWNTTIGSGVV
jgi:hypothetical protein